MVDPKLKTLTWLHFSDLHFKENDTPDASLTALIETLEKEATNEHGLHPDLIFFSGDIADEGRTGYTEAEEVFNRILSSTRLVSKKRICIVPGNHDVILDENKAQTKALKQEFEEDEDKARESFGDPKKLESLIKRFQGLQNFCTGYLEQPFDHRENRYFAKVIPVDGLRIGFVGLNSAWVSDGEGDNEYGHMFLGVSVIKEAFAKLESLGRPDMTFVMLHHPVEWLHGHERDEVEALLLEKADVVLTGHTHKGMAYTEKGPSTEDRKVLFLNAGATKPTEKRPKRVFLVEADVGRRRLKVYPKTFANGVWEKDTKFFPNMKGEYEPFDLAVVRDRCTIEVRNRDELEKVGNLTPYVENPAAGKFAKETTWTIGTSVDFSKLQPLDLTTPDKIFIITGKAGMGKSTYMLWSIDRFLLDSSWPFRKVVFLHPEWYEHWARDLYDCEPEETLLVIDALKRWEDIDSPLGFQERCSELKRLAFEGKIYHEKLIGPFKILATIRNEEYQDLVRLPAFHFLPIKVFEITPEDLDPRRILEKWLASYKIPYTVPAGREKEVIEKLGTKSLGSPFYIRHLAAELSRTNSSFSEDSLDEFPAGVVNLIWYTITKTYYVEADRAIPFLLLLLSSTNKPYSSYFLKFLVDRLSQTSKEEITKKVDSLKEFYFQDFRRHEGSAQIENFGLDSHWRESLEEGLQDPKSVDTICRDVAITYKAIADTEFNRLVEQIINELKTRLGEGFKDKADAFLCVDLARLSDDGLKFATSVYSGSCSSSKLEKEYVDYVQKELFELWISNAWKYRSVYDDERVVACYENAFEKLGAKSDFKQLHSYANYLQKRILPKLQDGTLEFNKCREKIERIYSDVITGQANQGVKDPISYQALAWFYAELGDDEKAEKAFKECLELDAAHIPSRQAYAIFLKGRGQREWARDTGKALEYYRTSEDQFKESIGILEKNKEGLSQEKFEKYESRLLNAYALFLVDKSSWERDFDQRTEIDKKVDDLFDMLTKKYPHHGQSVTAYSSFLMKYGRLLEKYKGGKNLEKAERLLRGLIELEEDGKERSLSYFMALHTLAVYRYKLMPSYYKRPPNLEEAEKNLRDSSRSFDPYHNSVAYNELGQLYVRWAENLRKTGDIEGCNEKMRLAKKAYEKAMEIIPENQRSAIHLSRVYFSYASCMGRLGDTPKSLEYKNKALEIARKFAYAPFGHYFALTCLGDEMLESNAVESAKAVFTEARNMGERLGINPWYAIFKLGEIFRKKGEIEEALKHYVSSAKMENTSEGWGTRRDSIRQLMDDWGIRKSKSPTIYGDCIKKRLECSKEAWQLDQTSWKNCGDYGEDLLEIGEFEEAIRILEIGVSLVQQSNELNEVDKRKKLSWFYEKIGFCYKDQGNSMRAEEHLLRAAETEDSAVGYFRAAGWMFELDSFEKTLMVFRKFIEKIDHCEKKDSFFRNMQDALTRIAISYENLSKEQEAALIWKDYAAISFYSNPKDGAYKCGKAGNRLMKLNRFLEARECFLKSNRLDPENARDWSQLGYVNRMLQRWEECAICSKRAFVIRGENSDRELSEFCQRQHKKDTRVTDSNSVEHIMDKAILSEILGKWGEALEFYSHIPTILEKQNRKDETKLSIRRFVADAIWILGRKDDALKLYEEMSDEVTDYEKLVVETIIWFIKKALDRQTDLDLKERILSLLKVGPLEGDSEEALSMEIGKRFGIDPLKIEKLFGSLRAEKLMRRSDYAEYSPATDSTSVSVVLSLAKTGQENIKITG